MVFGRPQSQPVNVYPTITGKHLGLPNFAQSLCVCDMKYLSNIAHRGMMLNGTAQINQPILKKCFIVPAPIRDNLQLTAITPVNSENGKCYGKPGSSDYYIVIPCCFCKLVYSDFMFLLAVASVPCIASSSFPQPAHLASE